MKKTLLTVFASALLICGCTTNQQKIAYNSMFSVEKTTVASYDGYVSLVVQGKVATNDVPKVAKAFNLYNKSFIVALDAVQFNTNAVAPSALVVESQDLINLINSIVNRK